MIREVINYEGFHVGMLGTAADDRFPHQITMYDDCGKIVAVGCTADPKYQGCVVAWGIMFYDNVKKSEISSKGLVA